MDRTLLEGLSGTLRAEEIADRALVSRSEWYRRQAAAGVRAPMGVRARLRLERAAYRLVRTGSSVSEIGVEAGFAYTSAFSRAFARSYGLPPRAYRAKAPTEWRIPPLGGLHYAPSSNALSPRQGDPTMKLIQIWIADHVRATETLLSAAERLPEAELDAPTTTRSPFPWEEGSRTLRHLLNMCVRFAEPWIHMLDGQPESSRDGSPESRRAVLAENAARLNDLVQRIEAEGSWDMTFVDHECEPPETFSYGSVVLHILVYVAHARTELAMELRDRGVGPEFLPPTTG